MKIRLSSIFVSDQEKALKFYTNIMGFRKKRDVPFGNARWLTVVSAEGPEDIELVLEPNSLPAAKAYQESLFDQGIACTAFYVDDIQKEFERLSFLGVSFTMNPTEMGEVTAAVLDDTCGNLIQLYQVNQK